MQVEPAPDGDGWVIVKETTPHPENGNKTSRWLLAKDRDTGVRWMDIASPFTWTQNPIYARRFPTEAEAVAVVFYAVLSEAVL
jgi:hypothetical protein